MARQLCCSEPCTGGLGNTQEVASPAVWDPPGDAFQGRPGRGTQGASRGRHLLKLCRLYIESNSMTAGTAPVRDPLLACIDGKQVPITGGGASVGDVIACPGDRPLTEAGVV